MRIAHVTNYWPNRYGHAHYTQNLLNGIHALRPDRQFVIGEGNTAAVETSIYRALPSWSRDSDYVDDVVRGLREVKADVAYLQYSNDVFGADTRFPRLLAEIEAAGIRTVVVTHSVYPTSKRTKFEPGRTVLEFDLAVAKAASCIHVHSPRMKTELVDRGVDAAQIAVIPHGSLALEARDPAASRAALGIPADAKVVLFFGIIWSGKGLERLLSAFRLLHKRVPEAFLYIGGYTRLRRWGVYVKYLQLRAALLGISRRTRLWGAYVPDEDVPGVYSAADVVAMPYRQDYASVSGVVHQTAGMGKLMLCSRIAKFDEVGDHISPDLLVDPESSAEWADGLERLLVDGAYAETMRARILRFADDTSWARVAERHVQLCDALVAGREAVAC
jgi:glycosyltransferase involved in cell wall biosynthesis